MSVSSSQWDLIKQPNENDEAFELGDERSKFHSSDSFCFL